MIDITAKIRASDGQLARVYPDGREELMTKRPIRPMTDAEIEAAALDGPGAPPLTPEHGRGMKRTPRAKIVRRALGLSQEEFALRYRIPLGTLRDWEQGRFEPDAAARAYLSVIARAPETVRRALETNLPQPVA